MNNCKECRFCKIVYRDNIIPFICKKYFCEKEQIILSEIKQKCNFFQAIEKDYQTNFIKNSVYDLSDERFKEIINDLKFLIDYYTKEEQGVVYESLNEYLIIHLNETLRKNYLQKYKKNKDSY